MKVWNVPSTADMKRPIARKLNDVHKRNKLITQFSFNSSRAQSDSGYDTVASVSTAAESYMPREDQSYATSVSTSVASSRVSSGRGNRRRMELNTTQTSFPNIKKPVIKVVDLSSEALAEARPAIRLVQDEIESLSKSIE